MWTSTLWLSLWDCYFSRTSEPVQAWLMSSSPTQAVFLYKQTKKPNLFQSSFIFFFIIKRLFFIKNRPFVIKSSAKQNIQSEMYDGVKMKVASPQMFK